MSLTDTIRRLFWGDPPDERGLTPQQLFNTGFMDYSDGWYSASGQPVTPKTAMEAALGACVRLIADDISTLPVDTYTRSGPVVTEVDAPPWLESPTGGRFDTSVNYIGDWVMSVGLDGGAFSMFTPNTFVPERAEVLDPTQVTIEERDGVTHYIVATAEGSRDLTDANIMYVPWLRMPGELRGINPVQSTRDSTGLELAARKYTSAFFRNGGVMGGMVLVPQALSQEQIDNLRGQFDARHKGEKNWFRPGVITGGATYEESALKPQEAELQPLWAHVLEEAARIYHIPPHLLSVLDTGAAARASVEERGIGYVRHAVRPFSTRFERAHSRLLPPGQFVKLNLNALMRGDAKTRAEYYGFMVNSVKAMKREEVRELEDLPYDGELGYLDTPNNVAPADREPTEEAPERSLTIDTVTIGDDSAARIANTAAAGAAVAADQVRQSGEKVSEEVAALRAEVQTQAEAIRMLADDRSRIEELLAQRNAPPDIRIDGDFVYYQHGSEVERKRVTRDDSGRVIGMVAA